MMTGKIISDQGIALINQILKLLEELKGQISDLPAIAVPPSLSMNGNPVAAMEGVKEETKK